MDVAEFRQQWFNSKPYIEAHTSGSTGIPKPVKLLKSDMRISARATNTFFGINKSSTLALPLSLDYIAGKMMAVRAFEAECKLLILPISNNIQLTEAVDLLAVVPSQIQSILERRETWHHIKHLLVGGAPLSGELSRAFSTTGIKTYIGYGMTETCSHVALRNLSDDRPIYTAMPDITFDASHEGCLTIKSEKFSWKKLQTRDLVELIDEKHFSWIGRADNVINSGGIKIFPEKAEHLIMDSLKQFPEFYIIGEDHAVWGQCAVAVARCSETEGIEFFNKIKALGLPKGWCPKAVLCVDDFMLTSTSGKIRRILPDTFTRIC